ncbi:MAG: AAA family ATPase [Blastocatellia bacterium]
MDNPFTVERAVRGKGLVNRVEELTKVKTTLKRAGKLFVIGPRRFGKTSILQTAVDQLREEGRDLLLFNVEGYTSIESLVRAILAETAGLSGNLKQATTTVRKFFSKLNPTISYNPVEGTFEASLGIKSPEPEEQSPLLVETLNNLEKMAASSRKRIGIVLDEFQQLLQLGGPAIEPQLRAAIQMHESVGYVFAGSQTTLLADMVNNPSRPFYRLGEPLFLKEVPFADFLVFLRQGFQLLKCRGEDEMFAHLYKLADGVPYHVQLLAGNCWDEIHRNPKKLLTREDVDAAQRRLVQLFAPYHAPLWAGLTPNQQRALALVARDTNGGLMSKTILKRLDMTPGTMHKALAALESHSIIRREYEKTAVIYRFEDPLFKAWIVSSITPGF